MDVRLPIVDSHILFARDDDNCRKDCPSVSPQCNCTAQQNCVIIARGCMTCASVQCNDKPSTSSGTKPGIIAGPIIAVLLILASLGLFWWLRRKKQRDLQRLEDLAERARKGESSAFHLAIPGSPGAVVTRSRHASQMLTRSPASGDGLQQQQKQARAQLPNVPADAEYYDENGTTIRVYTGKRGAINADPNHPDNGGNGDPFADQRSMSTAGSGASTNVIPIHYVPGGQSDDTLAQVLQNHGAAGGPAPTAAQQAAAARTLDLARQNLFRPRNGAIPPPRPARAPDLDLRLNPPTAGGVQIAKNEAANASRTSVGSFNSAAPSFLSVNTADVHLDAPQIITRTQVHVGRLQAAEVVHVANLRSPTSPQTNTAMATMVSVAAQDPFAGEESARPSLDSRRFDDDGNGISQPSPTDLRFSMGSLAFDRTSVSTTGTGFRPPMPPIERHRFESMSSAHSVGGESLGNFPMVITPASSTGSPQSLGAVPQNMSTTTLDLGAAPVSRASTNAPTPSDGRPLTTASSHSVADSFFGSFPFLPPNVAQDGSPTGPTTGPPPSTGASPSRLTLGMSGVSEGLGGFDFNFDGQDDDAAGSKEHVADPTTPRAPAGSRKW